MKSHSILNKMKGAFTLLMLLWLTALAANAQTRRNVLVVPQFDGGINKVIYVPIHLENTDPVTAVQFNIQLPYPVPTDGTPILSLRSDGHSASLISNGGNNSYKVVVLSMENKAIRGNKGLLLQIPMQVGNATANAYPITISDVVLTDKYGNNIATESTGGSDNVYEPILINTPDLVVPSITLTTTSAGPGSSLSFSYQVKNQGNAATKAGWTDKYYLESATTGVRLFLGSQRYSSTLGAGGTANRSFQLTLPTALHMDGQARVVVFAEPLSTTGEPVSDQWNNEGKSSTLVNLSKRLWLTTNSTTVYEGGSSAILTLTRSGDWSVAETFTISSSVSNIFTCNGMTMPCQVTIPARSSGVTLRIAAINDQIVKAREADITVANGNGYSAVSVHLYRVDNDQNSLTLNLSPTTMAEGGTVTLSATRGGELTDEVDMTVGCNHTSRFNGTATLHFAKNKSMATTTLQSIDDTTPQLDASVKFTISAPDYQTSSALLTLTDDDRPALTMQLSTGCVTENMSDNMPLTATITRDRGLDRAITVWLYSSRSEVTFEQNSVVIPAGSSSVSIPVKVKDNSDVDGQRTATLTAAFYSPYDRNTAPTGDRANAKATLTIVDDESPYLTLSASRRAVAEGGSLTLTVTRTQPSVSAPLSVTMSCADSRVSFTSQPVTIPANSKSATVTLKVAKNSVEGDDANVMVWASANGLGSAAMLINITDRTLPDAVNTDIQCVGEHFFSGLPVTVRATIRNYGTADLPKGMNIDFYLCNSNWFARYARHYNFFQATTNQAIAAGGEQTFEFQAQLPQMVGSYYVYARLNDDRKIEEFDYSNNLTKSWRAINIEAPFEVTSITAYPTDCLPGGAVNVQGTVEAVEGSQLNHQTVRVTLTGNGQLTSSDTEIDAQGRFNVTVPIDRSAYGYMTVKALALGQTAAAKTTTIHVYNMCFNSSDATWTVNENSTTAGTLRLKNLSAKSITITDFTSSVSLADGANVVFNTSNLNIIAAGATVSIPYTVTSTKPSTTWQYFTVTARSMEGLVTSLRVNYYCQATSSYLMFSPGEVKTTMLWNANRTVAVTVKNIGKKATGRISELITGDWVMSDFGDNRSLAPGEQATMHLTLLAKSSMHADRTYKTDLQLTPETGRSALLPITVTTTGDEYGRFDLYATDVYSKANDDYSHLAGASVAIINARTGITVATGTLDRNGHWMTTTMKEGVYNVRVTANRHKRVTTQISVGPGEDRTLTMFLPYKAVLTEFYVSQDENNHYYMQQHIDVDRQAPQGTIVATIDDYGFNCNTETMDIVLQNMGTMPAEGIRLNLPAVAGCTFTQLNEMPYIMMPGDKHIVQVAYTGPTDLARRSIASMSLRYEFNINGEMLSEEDNYQTLTGCVGEGTGGNGYNEDVPEKPNQSDEPGGSGGTGGEDNPDGNSTGEWTEYDDYPEMPEGDTWMALPTYGCFAKLTIEDVNGDIRPGQPIKGVLTVRNGLDAPLRSMRFVPQVANEEYEDCSDRFDYAEGSATGFTADGSYRKLEGHAEGTLNLTFTPLASAAANGEQVYLLGGQLEFIDSSIGSAHTATIIGVYVTVKTSGEVRLTYLIQRNFMADDIDTEGVEDTEPAIFALLAQNIGGTNVSGLKLSASQPTVVDNVTEESVAYASHYAARDGEVGNYTFTDLALEDIESGSTADVRWIYSSEQSAHVPNVAAVIDDVASAAGSGARITLAQPRKLLRAVATPDAAVNDPSEEDNELEQKVKVLADGNAYLLNDLEDEYSLPDAVITSDGEETSLEVVSDACTLERTSETGDYTLTVNATAAGWVYGRLADPTANKMRLESITRVSDGKKVSLANFWQSDRTPLADNTMLPEYLLHFADLLTGTEDSYLLHFVARPEDRVQLLSIRLLTADETEVAHDATTTMPVKTIEVEFTKGIRKLGYNHFKLKAHDENQDLLSLDPESEFINSESLKRRWTIDLSALPEVPGLHSFTLDQSELTPLKKSESQEPVKEKIEVNWTEDINGQALVTINIAPDDKCGTVSPATGTFAFGDNELKAIPSEGYTFTSWTDANGNVLSTDPTLVYNVWKACTLIAYFSPLPCDIEIICDTYGELKGNTSGFYPYDSEILLAVQPISGKALKYWKKDGLKFSEQPTVTDVVKGDARYVAVFKTADKTYTTTTNYQMAQGWNWTSSSLDGGDMLDVKQFLSPILSKVSRVVGFESELVNDASFGLVGQLKTINPTEGYKIYMTGGVSFTRSEETVDPETSPIHLQKGWNWIGYLPVRELTVTEALSGLQPMENDVLKTEDAFTTYTNGKWTGTLTTMKPGVGYMYYSGQPTMFNYPVSGMTSANARAAEASEDNNVAPWQYDAHQYADNTALIGELYVDGRPAMLGHCVVGAFVGDECRGIGRMVDGRLFLIIHGSLANEQIVSFRAYDLATSQEYAISESILFDGENVGTMASPMALHAMSATGISAATAGITIGPRPMKDKLCINGGAKAIQRVRVLAANGKVVVEAKGNETTAIDVQALLPGIYMVSITTTDGSVYHDKVFKE